jgi:methyl-accepting chemotaxis protein
MSKSISIKNLSIGVKIGSGFGVVIAIMLAMGIIAAVKMGDIKDNAEKLVQEYLPELSVCDKLERNLLLTQYYMRGYDVTGKISYAEDAKKYFEETKKNLKGAQELTAKYQGLVKLRESIEPIMEKIRIYEDVIEKSIEKHSGIISARTPFDASATAYMQGAHKLLDIQFESMKTDINAGASAPALLERLEKMEIIHEIITSGDAIRIANFKSQTFKSPEIAQEKMKDFDTILKYIEKVRPLLKKQENSEELAKIQTAAHEYKKTMEKVLQSWIELQDVIQHRVDAATAVRQSIIEVSGVGMDRVLSVANGATATLSAISKNMFVLLILAFIIAIIIAFSITYTIKTSIAKIADFTLRFGSGDLSTEVDIYTGDEIGQMAKSLNGSVKNLKNMMQELADTTHRLSSSSEELSAVSSEMASTAEEMSSQAITVAGASEQIAANVSVVAAASEESTAALSGIASMTEEMSSTFTHVAESGRKTVENVKDMAQSGQNISAQISSIASAAEEMTASLNEVAKHTVQANQMSRNASRRAEDVNTRMNILSVSSKKIGKIVGIIKDIADQTNMLALNATIEAAGAGDAGKGFAVVAGEIKELAKQSAGATDEIAAQIEEIQKSVADAVSAIGDIGKVINQTAAINEMIASSAEEQNATAVEISKSVANTASSSKAVAAKAAESSQLVEDIARAMEESSNTAREVAHSIDELFRSVQDVARSVDEAAKGVNEVSKNIHGISTASKGAAIGASQTRESSGELAKMAASLTEMVNRFRLG